MNGKPPLHPIDWAVEAGAAPDVLRELGQRLRRRRRRRGTALGVVALAVGGLFLARFHPARRELSPVGAAQSAAGAVLTAAVALPPQEHLSDGSLVELRGGARVSAVFTTGLRKVVLERGEALFHVTKDAGRPFIVQAGGVRVRAIGTAFTVNLRRKTVEIVVTEGRVAVDRSEMGEAAPLALAKGEHTLAWVDAGSRVVVATGADGDDEPAVVSRVAPADMSERLAWCAPRLEFTGTPLDEAIALVNRYSGKTLILAEPGLARVHLSGVIRADNVDTLVSLLRDEHGIRAERQPTGEIVLRPAP